MATEDQDNNLGTIDPKTGILDLSKATDLHPKYAAIADAVAKEYIDDLTVYRPVDLEVAKRWLKVVYGLYDKPIPTRIEVVASPAAAYRLASELTGEKVDSLDWCGVGDGGWVSSYDFYRRIGVLTEEEAADAMALRDFGRVARDTLLLDECAIVVSRPTAMRLDDQGNLHSTTGPCIEWGDGERDWAYHGEWVPEQIITGARDFTREEYLALTNTEQRRAVGEIAGWAFVADLLGAQTVNAWVDDATGLDYELLRCEDGLQLLRKTSPELADGSQPTYCEPVHEALRTAQAARKWQACRLTPEECEEDPVLTYGVEA